MTGSELNAGDIGVFFAAAAAWDAIWLQLLIIPFVKKKEGLQKDYITEGVLDAAISFIETKKLIPSLAQMFVRAREVQEDKRRSLGEDELSALLQEVDYIGDLEAAQSAMDEINSLRSLLDSLQRRAGRIFLLGLLHVLAVLSIPACIWLPEKVRQIGVTASVIVGVITLAIAFGEFLLFQVRIGKFLELIKSNRHGAWR